MSDRFNANRLSDAVESLSKGLVKRGFGAFLKSELTIDVTKFQVTNPNTEMFIRLELKPDSNGQFGIARWNEQTQEYTIQRVANDAIRDDTDSYMFKIVIEQYSRNTGKIFGQTRESVSRGKLPTFYAGLDLKRESVVLRHWNNKDSMWESYKLPDSSDVSLTPDVIETVVGNHILNLIDEFVKAYSAGKPNPYARPDMKPLRESLESQGKSKSEIDSEIKLALQGWKNRKNAKQNPRNKIYHAWQARNSAKTEEPQTGGTMLNNDGSLKVEPPKA